MRAQVVEGAQVASPYLVSVEQGIALFGSNRRDESREAFQRAEEMDATRPEAIFYLGELHRLDGDAEAALQAFTQASERAQSINTPRWTARALSALASTLEGIEGRLEDARSAWMAYVSFADANQAVAHPLLGRARLEALNAISSQEQGYAGVRERIAARQTSDD